MKITKILLLFVVLFAITSIKTTQADVVTEPLVIDGNSIEHYASSDPVMIPTTYTEKSAEFRGVWVATVYNLNMPRHTSETQYKAAYQALIDEVVAAKMNAIVFQVRPMNDAFYDSAYAPWSRWVTGTEGVDPGWDVMQYMIDTAHANGIEFHAWLNPYRVANTTSTQASYISTLHAENFAKIHPELVVSGNQDSSSRNPLILNPGEPAVKTYINNVIDELVTLYDVDGIHFDDYFYPYSGMSLDTATYNTYKEPVQTIEDWRRENVNDAVQGVKNVVDTYNTANGKDVRFGISPFGLWASGIPGYSKSVVGGSNTSPGNSTSYLNQFADSKKWVEEGWVHYICPQIYWSFEHSTAPYADVVDWWASVVRGTDVDLIIGHAISAAHSQGWNNDEISLQVKYNQKHPEISGSVMYSAAFLDKAAMADLNATQWTTTPTNTWDSSTVDAPSISIAGTADGAVYRSDVTVTLSATETIEYKIDGGLWQTYTTPLLFTTQGNSILYFKAVEAGGDESLVQSQNINIDKQNSDVPVISIAGDMIGSNYAVNSVVTLSSTETLWVAVNHGSVGVYELYAGPITLDETGGYYFRVKSVNSEGIESDEITQLITTQAACFDVPTISVSGTGTNDTYNEATITLASSTDIEYKINDGAWLSYSTPLVFDTEGDFTLHYRNDDECMTENNVVFTVDQTIPTMPVPTVTGDYDGSKYYTSETLVVFTPTDINDTVYVRVHNGSTWSAWSEYTEALVLNINSTYTIEYYATDDALNETEILDVRVRLKMPPTEDNVYVIRNGEIVTYYNSTIPIELPTTYTEKTEEVRAVWVATVANIDIKQHINESDYKSTIIYMLDTLEANNFNTMFFQVRPMNDAFYDSSYAPWSRYLTGVEGVDPGWDVFGYIIEEAHKRGIEVHAWMNPYRVSNGTESKAAQLALLHDENFAKQHPDLVMVDSGGKLILNPGEAQVQAYIKNVISEIMALYDVDGVHFDDYFYSYSGMSDSEDADVYNSTKLAGQSLDDWRRENINNVVEDIFNLVEAHNLANGKHVKFGISPFGIWASGGIDGSNTSPNALQSYKDQYADSKKWVEEGWLHYILPQLYWEMDHTAAPFADLAVWWAELCEEAGVDLIIGQGFYRYDNDTWDDEDELLEQIRFISQFDSVIGVSFFSYRTLNSYDQDVLQAIERLNDFYWTEYPAFPWDSDVVKSEDTCPDGFELIGIDCVPTSCPVGEQLVGIECEAITCEVGEVLDGNDCIDKVCPVGETLLGNNCIPKTCPVGESLEGNDCIAITCATGEELKGNNCVEKTCPVGEVLDGDNCVTKTCPIGQELDGNNCVEVKDESPDTGCFSTFGAGSIVILLTAAFGGVLFFMKRTFLK